MKQGICSCTLLFILFIAPFDTSFPQGTTPFPRGLAMGHTGVSFSSGVDALGLNPSAVGYRSEKRFSLSCYPFSMFLGTDLLDYGLYKKYFTGVENETGGRDPYVLNEQEKTLLLNNLKDGAGRISTSAGLKQIAFTAKTDIGNFGFHLEDKFELNLALSHDYIEFLFFGNPPGKQYNFKNTTASSIWTRGYAVTYAKDFSLPFLKSVHVGVTGKLLHGFEYIRLESFDTRFVTDPDSFHISGHANVSLRYSGTEFFDTWMEMLERKRRMPVSTLYPRPVGQGFGMDIGTLVELHNGMTVAFSITDFNSSITWSRNTKKIETDDDFIISDLFDGSQMDSLDSVFNGIESSIPSFTTRLPGRFYVGASWSFDEVLGESDRLLCAVSYTGKYNILPGALDSPSFGMGAEWEFIGGVPVRAGLAFGGYRSPLFTFGVGFLVQGFAIDMNLDNLPRLLSDSASDLAFALALRVDFDSFK